MSVVAAVVQEIARLVGDSRPVLMLVGAECRNLIHGALGASDYLTATSDLDLGIVVDDWSSYLNLTQQLTELNSSGTGIRFQIAELPVDLMPFGSVESPTGTVTPPSRKVPLSVFGFREVAASATRLEFSGGGEILIPSIAGFTALKMKAWLDRHPSGEYKDGGDLALACAWMRNVDGVNQRMMEEIDPTVFAEMDYDDRPATARLLGRDVTECLGSHASGQLATSWEDCDKEVLARYFGPRTLPIDDAELNHRLKVIGQLSEGLNEAFR